jgi:hypothetical protein
MSGKTQKAVEQSEFLGGVPLLDRLYDPLSPGVMYEGTKYVWWEKGAGEFSFTCWGRISGPWAKQ